MFTGIIEGLAKVRSITPRGHSYTIVLDLHSLAADVKPGDSVAVNGTCLTATKIHHSLISFDVITETVALTNLSTIKIGDKVNVERSMPANGRFHGHVVSGHVDGTARLSKIVKSPGQTTLTFQSSEDLTDQMIHKGSITIDGISLTLILVAKGTFSVALIPHTLEHTNLHLRKTGDLINIEVDQLGKWVRKILSRFVAGVPAPKDDLAKPDSVILSPDSLRKYLG